MADQAELPLPETDNKPFCWTSCAHCDAPVHRDDVVIKQYVNGYMTLIEHFCSDKCHHAWYINRLRSWGM